jgi:hypothetical protein
MKTSNLLPNTFHVHIRYQFSDSEDCVPASDGDDEISWIIGNCKGRVDVLWHESDDVFRYRLDLSVVDGQVIQGYYLRHDDAFLDFLDVMEANEDTTLMFAFEDQLSATHFALEFAANVAV